MLYPKLGAIFVKRIWTNKVFTVCRTHSKLQGTNSLNELAERNKQKAGKFVTGKGLST